MWAATGKDQDSPKTSLSRHHQELPERAPPGLPFSRKLEPNNSLGGWGPVKFPCSESGKPPGAMDVGFSSLSRASAQPNSRLISHPAVWHGLGLGCAALQHPQRLFQLFSQLQGCEKIEGRSAILSCLFSP